MIRSERSNPYPEFRLLGIMSSTQSSSSWGRRFQRSWAWRRLKLTLYGEVLNVTNHPNRIVTSSFYTQDGQLVTTTAEALPVTPTLGLAFEFSGSMFTITV